MVSSTEFYEEVAGGQSVARALSEQPTGHFRSRTSNPSQPPINVQPLVQSFTMGRLHSNGKGISASAIPYSRNPPAWLKTTPEQVVEQIGKLAKKGATPSQYVNRKMEEGRED
jgi:hypothetical protein